MKQIDLDDLPPRAARLLEQLDGGEELVLCRNGLVVGRLTAATSGSPEPGTAPEPPSEETMAEVLDHFRTMIEEEF